MDIDPILRDVGAAVLAKPYITVDSAAGVPPRAGESASCSNHDLIGSGLHKVSNFKDKLRVAAFPFACNFPIDIDNAIHIDSVKNEKQTPSLYCLKVVQIPTGSVSVEIVGVFD